MPLSIQLIQNGSIGTLEVAFSNSPHGRTAEEKTGGA
jgi:hypothetical protein